MTVHADPTDCSFQFDPIGRSQFTSSCDLIRTHLSRAGVNYDVVDLPAGSVAQVHIGEHIVPGFRAYILEDQNFTAVAGSITREAFNVQRAAFDDELGSALAAAGYPASADSAQVNKPLVVAILFLLVMFVTMVYGPIAAALVEMFPTNIRYSSMSLPYHIGNGWFGGFLPTTAFAIVAATGNIYAGLWYPIAVALLTFVVGLIWVRDRRNVDLTE